MGKRSTEGLNCWEFRECGMDKTRGCPAYPLAGRICYMVAGTMCGGKPHSVYAEKSGDCKKCDFFKGLIEEKTP